MSVSVLSSSQLRPEQARVELKLHSVQDHSLYNVSALLQAYTGAKLVACGQSRQLRPPKGILRACEGVSG